jgi:hypothetical protein
VFSCYMYWEGFAISLSVRCSTFEMFSQTSNEQYKDWFCSFSTVNICNRKMFGSLSPESLVKSGRYRIVLNILSEQGYKPLVI